MMMMFTWKAVALVVAGLAAVHGQDAQCCDKCLAQNPSHALSYDPLVFEQCENVPDVGKGICCFECGEWNTPEYADDVTYGDDGITPQIKSGTWVRFEFKGAEKVTYITLREGQKKSSTPTLEGSAADKSDSFFLICAKSPGQVVFRGWGEDTCRQASKEQTVTILEGEEGATCSATAPPAPAPTSGGKGGSSNNGVQQCNLNRGSIETNEEGKEECVCASGWEGPPSCDKWPLWKWLASIGGGVAALLSILISIRAFLTGRKKKQMEEADLPLSRVGKDDDVETLHISPHRRSTGATSTQYNQNVTPPGPPAQPKRPTAPVGRTVHSDPDREFTL